MYSYGYGVFNSMAAGQAHSMKVIWSEQALLDVEHIRDYIAQDSPDYAQPFIERVLPERAAKGIIHAMYDTLKEQKYFSSPICDGRH